MTDTDENARTDSRTRASAETAPASELRGGGDPPIEALLFDLDGLMLDTEPLYERAWREAAGTLGFELETELYRSLIGRDYRDSVAELARRWGSGFDRDRFHTLWTEAWHELIDTRGISRKPGLDELLDWSESRSWPRAVATSSERRQAERSLAAADLSGRFEVLVPGDEIARGKPEPDIYEQAARQLGVEPRRTVALEDSNAGVRAAAAAGCRVFMVPDRVPPSPEARAAAYAVCRSLHQVRERLARTDR